MMTVPVSVDFGQAGTLTPAEIVQLASRRANAALREYMARTIALSPRVACANECPQCGAADGHAPWCGWSISNAMVRR